MKLPHNIIYVGVTDREVDLFEGQYPVPDGISYNSYVITDEKTAVLDTVDAHFTGEWLENVEAALGGRQPDYLVIHHMEPDHSAGIVAFMDKYPSAAAVATAQAFRMMAQFFGTDYSGRRVVVRDGDALALGEHTLTFVTAPMVHWPEVAVSYESREKILFSADAFGSFATADITRAWDDEARRYYIGIVGKYGKPVRALLAKAAALDIAAVCPLHGPVLTDGLERYFGLYSTWASYEPETPGVVIAYASVYGNTKKAALLLADRLSEAGCANVVLHDLCRCDMSAAVADAFRYSKLVLASPTYNGGVFPCVRDYIERLTEREFRGRTVAFIENGSWAPRAAKVMRDMLAESEDIGFAENGVTVVSALNDASRAQISRLAAELAGTKH